MKFSEKLNGYWEDGQRFYLEIRDDKMTLHMPIKVFNHTDTFI